MMEIDDKGYRTSSLDEAAAIMAAGGGFTRLEKKSHRTYLFVFLPSAMAAALADGYLRGTLVVNATALTKAQRDLKDVLFATLRQGDRDGDSRSRN